MARTLLERARNSGANVLLQTAATQLLLNGASSPESTWHLGEVVRADTVVIAAGRWTQDFLARLGVDVPLVHVESKDSKAVGLLVTVLPTAGRPRTVLHSREVNWAPRPSGYAVLASASADRAIARDRSPETVRATVGALLKRAADLSARFAGASFEHTHIGLRALPIDGSPVCGWINSIGGLYVVVTHSGITLAPLLSQLVAQEILDGVEHPCCVRSGPRDSIAPLPSAPLWADGGGWLARALQVAVKLSPNRSVARVGRCLQVASAALASLESLCSGVEAESRADGKSSP